MLFLQFSRSFSILQVRFLDNAVLFLLLKIHCSLLKYTNAPRASRRADKTRVKERACDREVVQALHPHRSGYELVEGKGWKLIVQMVTQL